MTTTRNMRSRRRNNRHLLKLMDAHGLTISDVAALVRVSIHAAHAWTKPTSSVSSRPVPDSALELLCLKLGVASPLPAHPDEPDLSA